ncbi:hypothetical protein IWX90DRAFT_12361 [Phyllosticta citrichinensis]|uniref:Secreted protein n=1 Tax=Phyllosticta citrichinensis TaxID=1130410 RepID=A0ABR1Y6L3_9PEZI
MSMLLLLLSHLRHAGRASPPSHPPERSATPHWLAAISDGTRKSAGGQQKFRAPTRATKKPDGRTRAATGETGLNSRSVCLLGVRVSTGTATIQSVHV